MICPEYQILKYSTTNRHGSREYKSDGKICANCPTRELCTHSKDCAKTVQRQAEVIDSPAFSEFCGVDSCNQVPDGDPLGRFRHILEENGIQQKLFAR